MKCDPSVWKMASLGNSSLAKPSRIWEDSLHMGIFAKDAEEVQRSRKEMRLSTGCHLTGFMCWHCP